MTITWNRSYETGDPAIDEQHRKLLALVNDLETAQDSRETLVHALDEILKFTITHFAIEEDLMDRVQYPVSPKREMIEQHREFASYARLRFLEFRRGDLTSVVTLRDYLGEWLTLHEFGVDELLATFIHQREEAAVPRT